MLLTDQRQCSPLGAQTQKPIALGFRSERTLEDDEMTITAKDLDMISEVVKASRIIDQSDMTRFNEKLDSLDERMGSIQTGLEKMIVDHTALKNDMQGLLDAWRAGSTLLGTAKVASKVVGAVAALFLAIGVIGSLITHPDLWFSKGN